MNNPYTFMLIWKREYMAIGLKNKLLIVFCIVCLSVLYLPAQDKSAKQSVDVLNFQQLQPLLHNANDSVYVVNFWATWCAPCVDEIPHFERLSQVYRNENIKILMVSLDFPNHLDSRLIPFIEQNGMQNEVVLLNDPDANNWISLVDSGWSGAIPATLIYNKNHRAFYQKEFNFETLNDVIQSFLDLSK